jgi:anti-anti-sigma factor
VTLPTFRTYRDDVDGIFVLALEGELDIATAAQLKRELDEIINAMPGPVVVDLTALTFLDSSGAAVLLDVARRLTRAQRMFALACPDGAPRQALEMMRLTNDLHVVDDRELAEEAVRVARSAGRPWFVASGRR